MNPSRKEQEIADSLRNYTKQELLHQNLVHKRASGGSDTITYTDRRIFWYINDEVARQEAIAEREDLGRVTYEDHRKAIETAVYVLKQTTQKDIALTIMSHRFFKLYRAKAFRGDGDFYTDYSFLVTKVGMIFTANTSKIVPISAAAKLQAYTEPTLVQINYITGTTKPITLPKSKLTLQQWCDKFNSQANESTVYHVAGQSAEALAA